MKRALRTGLRLQHGVMAAGANLAMASTVSRPPRSPRQRQSLVWLRARLHRGTIAASSLVLGVGNGRVLVGLAPFFPLLPAGRAWARSSIRGTSPPHKTPRPPVPFDPPPPFPPFSRQKVTVVSNMQLKHLSFAALVGAAAAQQNLTSVLASNNQTSQLATFLSAFPQLLQTLQGASNITLLAPSNQALGALLNTSAGAQLQNNSALAQAVLQYHVLNGTYPASAITNRTAFIPTLLTNQTYANITGGQVVDAIAVGGNVTFFSGLFQNATVVQPVGSTAT